jgi:hypothetical protein
MKQLFILFVQSVAWHCAKAFFLKKKGLAATAAFFPKAFCSSKKACRRQFSQGFFP